MKPVSCAGVRNEIDGDRAEFFRLSEAFRDAVSHHIEIDQAPGAYDKRRVHKVVIRFGQKAA